MSPPRRVLGRLWTRQKQDITLICILVAAPAGEELRVLHGAAIHQSEMCVDRPTALQRAEILRRQLDATGWVPA